MINLIKKYILDIETKPQENLVEVCKNNIKVPKTYKDEEKIQAYIKEKVKELKNKMSVDTDYADIICIGLKEIGKEPKLISNKELEELFKKDIVLITYNGKGFDIPLLIKYGIKNNLDLPYKRLREMTKRYSELWHIDLMEVIGDYGQYKSLDELLQIYLGISKKPIDFETATEKEIKEHCLEDLVNTELLYNKFNKII